MAALCSPVARITISRASRIVATPIVIASRGTLSSPKKSAAASCRVTGSSVTSRVRLSAPEPGSLKPMWPVSPDAEELEIDPARGADRLLVFPDRGLGLVARQVAPRDVHVGPRDVELREQILPHEAVVGMDASRIHRVVLVQVERDHVPEAEPLLPVHPDQLAVDADGGGPGGEAQHGAPAGRGLGADDLGDSVRHQAAEVVVVVHDDGADALEGHGPRKCSALVPYEAT